MAFKKGHLLGRRFQKGFIPWNKGKKLPPMSLESRRKMSASRVGRKVSPETRAKISKSHTGKKGGPAWNKGKKFPERSGCNHFNWKGGYENTLMLNRKRRALKFKNGGSHTLADWQLLKAQYNWTCPCCGKIEDEITLTEDHIIPLSKGGSDNIENIQPLCRSCNSMKKANVTKY